MRRGLGGWHKASAGGGGGAWMLPIRARVGVLEGGGGGLRTNKGEPSAGVGRRVGGRTLFNNGGWAGPGGGGDEGELSAGAGGSFGGRATGTSQEPRNCTRSTAHDFKEEWEGGTMQMGVSKRMGRAMSNGY